MAGRHLPLQQRFVSRGGLRVAMLFVLLMPGVAGAAVVRSVHAQPTTATTRIVIRIDGGFRFHSHASSDGDSVYIDIDEATLDDAAARVLPISDERVDGVIVLADAQTRVVRIAVDIAGRIAPRLVAGIEGSMLMLDFVDASSMPAPSGVEPAHQRPPATVAARKRATGATIASSKAPAVPAPGGRSGGSPLSARHPAAQKPLVILDPGHGGKDPGARAWTGEAEKDLVLDLAERVARRLRARGEVEVVMTRSGDEFVALADRRDASRRWDADAFVSIHANASGNAAARGIETYFHSRIAGGSSASPSARVIRRLARAENGGQVKRNRSTYSIAKTPVWSGPAPVIDRRAESSRLAALVQSELVERLGMRYEAVRDLGAKEGPFFVIGNNAAPSVLVEAAFLTHREEGLRMRSEVYREQIADGVARGIVRFLQQQRRAGVL